MWGMRLGGRHNLHVALYREVIALRWQAIPSIPEARRALLHGLVVSVQLVVVPAAYHAALSGIWESKMKVRQGSASKQRGHKRLHTVTALLGLVAIAVLVYILFETVEDHMARAKELSRDAQWQLHAPVAGAHAAAVLQGVAP